MESEASVEQETQFRPAPDCPNYVNGQAMRLPPILLFCACPRCRRFARYVAAGAENEYVVGSCVIGP